MLTTRAISEAVEFVGSVVRIFVTCLLSVELYWVLDLECNVKTCYECPLLSSMHAILQLEWPVVCSQICVNLLKRAD